MKDVYNIGELIEGSHGKIGVPKRDELERELKVFKIGLLIRKAREEYKPTAFRRFGG